MGTSVDQLPKLAVDADQTYWNEAQQQALLRMMGVGNPQEITVADLQAFLHVVQRTGLDPFNREIHYIGRYDGRLKRKVWTVQTGIDGYRYLAETSAEYAGQDAPEWCDEEGNWHEVWLDHEKPPSVARVRVFRKGMERPVVGIAHYSEYVPMKEGKPTGLWPEKPALMLAKCAEALALRKAFPRRLSGIYVHEEMDRADASAVQATRAVAAEARREAALALGRVDRTGDEIPEPPPGEEPDPEAEAWRKSELLAELDQAAALYDEQDRYTVTARWSEAHEKSIDDASADEIEEFLATRRSQFERRRVKQIVEQPALPESS